MKSPADGYTLLLCGVWNAISASLYDKLNFDFARDIAPIAAISRAPNVMVVTPSFPAKTVPEFIAYAKANPGKVNMASTGVGTSLHLSGELFMMMTGIEMQHVPYRGSAPMLTDLLPGQVQVAFDNLQSSHAPHQGGHVACAGGDDNDAVGRTPGSADGRRFCAGLRREHLEWRRRAKEHSGRDC